MRKSRSKRSDQSRAAVLASLQSRALKAELALSEGSGSTETRPACVAELQRLNSSALILPEHRKQLLDSTELACVCGCSPRDTLDALVIVRPGLVLYDNAQQVRGGGNFARLRFDSTFGRCVKAKRVIQKGERLFPFAGCFVPDSYFPAAFIHPYGLCVSTESNKSVVLIPAPCSLASYCNSAASEAQANMRLSWPAGSRYPVFVAKKRIAVNSQLLFMYTRGRYQAQRDTDLERMILAAGRQGKRLSEYLADHRETSMQ